MIPLPLKEEIKKLAATSRFTAEEIYEMYKSQFECIVTVMRSADKDSFPTLKKFKVFKIGRFLPSEGMFNHIKKIKAHYKLKQSINNE